MSATTVIRHELASISAVLDAVPASRIFIGMLPKGTALPAIGITSVYGEPRNTLSMRESSRLIHERVQVTAYARSYPELDGLIRIIAGQIKNKRGEITQLQVRSIIPLSVGPHLEGVSPVIHTQSLDFRVSYLV